MAVMGQNSVIISRRASLPPCSTLRMTLVWARTGNSHRAQWAYHSCLGLEHGSGSIANGDQLQAIITNLTIRCRTSTRKILANTFLL